MKKLLLILMLAFSFESFAQTEIQSLNANLKKSKGGFIVSGATLIAGSILNHLATNLNEPEPLKFGTVEAYNDAYDGYVRQKRNLQGASTILYGISGASLIIGVTISF